MQTGEKVREGGCGEQEEEGRGASGSGSEDLAVNGQSDADHISFSYSSDEDFLPHHLKQGGDMKPSKVEKPYHEAGVELGKERPSVLREAISDHDRSRSGTPDPLPSFPELDRERRKNDHLSLAQRRRRLCSIARTAPLAPPTATLATPTSSALTTPTMTTGHCELSRQPISPGLHYTMASPLKHSQSHNDGRIHTNSTIPRSAVPPASNKPLAEDEEEGSESESLSDSDNWSPGVQRRKKTKKKKMKKDECREREQWTGHEGMGDRGMGRKGRRRGGEQVEGRERRKEKKKKSFHSQPLQQPKSSPAVSTWPESHSESDSSNEGLSRVKDMVKKRSISCAKHDATEELKDSGTKWLNKDSSDDEKVLEELKRKVKEEVTEHVKVTSCEVTSGSLEEELAVSTSSDSEPETTPPRRSERASDDTHPHKDSVDKEDQLAGHVEEVEEEVARWGKARPKRQVLSSGSESDGCGSGQEKKRAKEEVNGPGGVCGPRPAQRLAKPGGGERIVVRDDLRKRGPDSSAASPAKQLRLIDIDFTGGRMKQLPPHRPLARHSPARPRTHTSTGPGPDRKLKSVPANATNILKSSKPVKLVPNLFHSSKSSWSPLPCKKSTQERKPVTHKDTVLAAKFPQKRKLLDIPPIPNRAHKNSKLKPSHKLS